MSRLTVGVIAFTAALSALGPPAGAAAAPQSTGSTSSPDARPVSGTGAAIAGGEIPVAVWLQDGAEEWRVLGRVGDSAGSVRLGPTGGGDDGAPAIARTDDGAVWVLASRAASGARQLWLQSNVGGAWGAPRSGPAARPADHHPALAAIPDSGGLWAVWIGEEPDGQTSNLWASRWTGTRWTSAEPLPRLMGNPMAPAIAVGSDGAPIVAWAANDGTDAEVWVTSRRGGRWSAPRALSSNDVPDITPSIAATDAGLVVTWISYTDEGYLPMAAIAARSDAWGPPEALSATPGSRPRALAVDGRPAVFWRRLEEEPAGGTIVARILAARGWTAEADVAPASGSPFDVVTAADGRLLMAFSRPDGRLGVLDGGPNVDRIGALAAANAARYGGVPELRQSAVAVPAPSAELLVPRNYTAFGDSLTNGVVYDPERRTSGGYRDPLQQMLRAYFRIGTVFNAGVDGEGTSDGVGRIDNAISAQNPQAILIMEGTNDILGEVEVSVIEFNLRRMVERSYEENPDIKPFLAQLPPRLAPGPDGFDGSGNGRIDELNALLPALGEEERAVIVDMNTPIDGHREYMSNHVHPSVAGYQVMAEQWYDAIVPEVLDDTNRGDLDGSGRIDGLDLVQMAIAFGALEGDDRYNPAADINGDAIVDGFDLDLLIEFFGQDVSGSDEGGS